MYPLSRRPAGGTRFASPASTKRLLPSFSGPAVSRLSLLTFAAICLGVANNGFGQFFPGGWGGHRHASTVAESHARGMADAVRSQGMANLMNARALGEIEDARSKYIDNRLRATQAYYDRRKIRDEYREEQQIKTRYYLAQRASALNPLKEGELEPTSGEITWPSLLMQPQFAEHREFFNDVFAHRAAEGVASNEDYIAATNRSKRWRQQLTEQRDEYDFNELREAILFIRRLVGDLEL